MGYHYSYAISGFERANVTNAYNSNHIDFFDLNIVYVECNTIYNSKTEMIIDHHHEGDYGYDFNHEYFLEASSIGQFLKYILSKDFFYVVSVLKLEMVDFIKEDDMMFYSDSNWYFYNQNGTVKIPNNIVLLAGIDHCLLEAYDGKCKGISHLDLFERRIRDISIDLNITIEYLEELVEKYLYIIKNTTKKIENILDLTDISLGEGIYTPDYLIIRELAILNKIAVAVKVVFEDIEKIMFVALSKDLVSEIMNKKEFNGVILEDMFGVPNRGYAGGFIKK